MEKQTYIIKEPRLVSEELKSKGLSWKQINQMLKKKDIRINGKRIKEDELLVENDELTFFYLPEEIKCNILFVDENIIIADKPFGIEIEGEKGLAKELNALPVHRLDRNTTGLMIFAKNKTAQELLFDAFKNHTITKKYYAEVASKADYKNYKFDAFLVKDSSNSQVKIYTKKVSGAESISTTFNTIKSSPSSSLIECTLHTGKTHQIRASLAYLGYPIIGDGKYGKNEINKRFNEKRQRLHSHYIKLDGLKESLAYLNGKEFSSKPDWVK